jgi:hypothetical protein
MRDLLIFAELAKLSGKHTALQKATARKLGITEDLISEAIDRLELSTGKDLVRIGPPKGGVDVYREGKRLEREFETAEQNRNCAQFRSKKKRGGRLTYQGYPFGSLADFITTVWNLVNDDWKNDEIYQALRYEIDFLEQVGAIIKERQIPQGMYGDADLRTITFETPLVRCVVEIKKGRRRQSFDE